MDLSEVKAFKFSDACDVKYTAGYRSKGHRLPNKYLMDRSQVMENQAGVG
jgi:hypothetical protein